MPRWLAILLVSLAGLLLEVGYTRIVSYKLWYYYTYLVIGLALLGIGSGGVLVAVSAPLRRWTTQRIVAVFSIAGSVSISVGYLVVARMPVDTIAIWDYGTGASLKNLAALGLICFALFATFIALGVIVSVLLGRAREDVGRIYFADLTGAGVGCLIAIPLISALGPPALVALAALVFAAVGVLTIARPTPLFAVGCVVAVLLGGVVVARDSLPDVRVESTKLGSEGAVRSEWGPVFRVDALDVGSDDMYLLAHDGTFGSGIHRFDGDPDSLTQYDSDPRALPFHVLGEPPERELIIGSAGGNEILASLAFDAPHIEAVELNPVTVGLLEDEFADFSGHLPERPEVDMHVGDGRSYLARSDVAYDLVWFVAPDSYAAMNAASSGAFVLSESYLYTTEMISETLEHLSDDGIMVVQFGELDVEASPNRTARYVVTARQALADAGVEDPTQHLLVSALLNDAGDLSTIIVKRTPFTAEEIDAFAAGVASQPSSVLFHAPGHEPVDNLVTRLASGTAAEVDTIVDRRRDDISAVHDDAPFFWHFSKFDDVLSNIDEPIDGGLIDPEDAIGERVLLLLLGFAVVYAAVFLLLPFVVVRRRWASLPAKGTSAIYFACLGLGFMLFEITMIQRLSRFLGYPTYSLTVTLASLLVATGIGASLSRRLDGRERALLPWLVGALAALTAFYQFGLPDLLDALLDQSLAVRVIVALVVLAPLGLLLGLFMPVGLGIVLRLAGARRAGDGAGDGEEYVAWAWAVNGFFSVIGSVLTTILSMTFGFSRVQYGALVMYAIAALALLRLHARHQQLPARGEPDVPPVPLQEPAAPEPART
jgi:hypothetical protein